MSLRDYWDSTPSSKSNLRLFIPSRGWVAYDDRTDADGNTTERGSRELVESILINALSAAQLVSLTGAGASFCAKNAEGMPQAPSMQDLWNAVENDFGTWDFSQILDTFPNANIGENIEKLLSLCKVYLELNEAAEPEDNDVSDVKRFVSRAEACILSKVDFVNRDTSLAAHTAFVRKIGRRGFRKTRAKVFTTNYDLTIEEAARRLRFIIIDGFSHSLEQIYDRQYFDLDLVRRDAGKDTPDYIPNVFQLYKMHGSTDWRRIGTDVVRSRDSTVGSPVLIYPRSSKYQEAFEPPYLDMMGAFQSALREPETALIVAGFGFNDDHISRPILSALESNLTLRLVICDPTFIQSVDDLRGNGWDEPALAIPTTTATHQNPLLRKITALATQGDQRIHLLNGRFEDLADALPDLIGETDRERHMERVKILRDREN